MQSVRNGKQHEEPQLQTDQHGNHRSIGDMASDQLLTQLPSHPFSRYRVWTRWREYTEEGVTIESERMVELLWASYCRCHLGLCGLHGIQSGEELKASS